MDFLGFLSEILLTISWLVWAFIVWVKKRGNVHKTVGNASHKLVTSWLRDAIRH